MKLSYFFIFFLFSTLSFAQNFQYFYQKADSLVRKRDFKNAIPFYEQALPLVEKELGNESADYLSIRNGLGRAISYVGEKEKIEFFLLENITLCKKHGEKTALYAQALQNIGLFYLPNEKGRDSQKSETYLKQALNLQKEILGTKHIDYTISLAGLANLYYFLNNYLLAEPLYKEVLQIRKEILGTKHPEYLRILNNLASLYMAMGNHLSAERLYQESLETRREVLGEKHIDYTQSLNNLGILYASMGNYFLAEQFYQESIKIRKEIVGVKHNNYALSLNNLASLYTDLKAYSKAEKLYFEVLEIRKEVLGEKHPDYARVLRNLAVFYQTVGNFAKSETLLKQSLQIYKESVGVKHLDYIAVLGNLAETYRALHRYALADSLLKEELAMRKETPNLDLYWNYRNLGITQSDQGNYQEAEANLLKASELLRKIQGRGSLIYTQQAQDLGLHYWQQGKLEKAQAPFLEIQKNAISLTQELFPILSEAEKESFFEGIKQNIKHFNAFATEQKLLGEMYDLQLFSKGVLLNANQKMRNRILSSGDSVLIGEYEKWANLKLTLSKYAQMSQEELEKTGAKKDSLEKVVNETEKYLSLKSESFATLADKKLPTWRDIKKKLRKGEAAVEIVRINKFGLKETVTDSTDHTYYRNSISLRNGISEGKFPQYPFYALTDTVYYAALIVRHNSKEPELVVLSEGNKMENQYFKMYRNSAKYQILDKNSYQRYWQAIKERLKGVRKVYFSPDGVYNQINLNILQNPQNQQYILDEVEIQQVTNTKEILAFANSNPAGFENPQGFKAVLFGRPAYDMDSLLYLVNVELTKKSEQNYVLRDLRDLRSGKFSDLLGTEQEVNLIDSMLRNKGLATEKYMLARATEPAIKTIRSPSILHIATHGFFIADSTTKNPMLNSGILLAGVSNYYRLERKPDTDDGVLTSQEAQNLHLDQTDLVVLSACETGLGEVRNGEGVYGLQRAFKVAGVKSLLMSHWKIDDRVTQELMSKFYEYWLRLGDRRKAFIQAQAQIRKRYPSPYYWGAFVLVGQ